MPAVLAERVLSGPAQVAAFAPNIDVLALVSAEGCCFLLFAFQLRS